MGVYFSVFTFLNLPGENIPVLRQFRQEKAELDITVNFLDKSFEAPAALQFILRRTQNLKTQTVAFQVSEDFLLTDWPTSSQKF